MQLTINDKTYEVKFGVKFVRAMDEKYRLNTNGVEFGAGLEATAGFLFNQKITTLADYLYYGTITEKPRPSQNDIDDYLDTVEDIEAVFDEVIAELEASNASKLYISKAKKEFLVNQA